MQNSEVRKKRSRKRVEEAGMGPCSREGKRGKQASEGKKERAKPTITHRTKRGKRGFLKEYYKRRRKGMKMTDQKK